MRRSSVGEAGWRRRRRWWSAVAAVFAIQVGLIFLLGERGPVSPRPARRTPILRLVEAGSAESLALRDPTLFVLPHRRGFSGPAWLQSLLVPSRPPDWSEEPRYLQLAAARLGVMPPLPAPPDAMDPMQLAGAVQTEWALLEPPPLLLALDRSRLRIEGELARRPLLTPLDLPPWQHNELLTNTVVQMLVDAQGRPLSPTLLHGSGLPKADDYALAQSRTLRFGPPSPSATQPQPLPAPLAHLTWGALVFEWHTVPLQPTNAPALK